MKNYGAIYLCNPGKNVVCAKKRCAFRADAKPGDCYFTSHPEYALQDRNGNLLPAGLWRRDGYLYDAELAKKPFHERFWWLPAAIGLIAIAASGAGVLIAALA